MALNFPSNPILNQVYTGPLGQKWKWNGEAWISFNEITIVPTASLALSGVGPFSGSFSGSLQASSVTVTGNQTISGSLTIRENLTVLGSASITFISESTLNIGTNLITVNTINPGARFGGLAVIDSGSSPLVSASFLYDSIQDEFLFIHKGTAGGVLTSSVFLLGPETFNDVGNEIYLTANRIPKGTGIEHLNDSNISDNGSVISINSNTQVTGSLIVTQGISGSFSGSGADLFGIPASGIVGLNLSQISSGSYSASISDQGLLVNTRVVADSFSGSFSGSGANLYDIPASGITGLTGYDGFNVTQSFASSNTWTFVHNLGHQFVSIQTYDLNYDEIIPENIDLFNDNTAVITFPTPESGYALAVVGGGTITNTIVNGSVNTNSFATTGSNTFIGNQLITGSLQVTGGTIIGSLTGNADTATTASFAQTASFVQNAQTASFVTTAQTASYVLNAVSASFVTTTQTASYVLNAVSASFTNTLYNTDGTITSARTVTLGNNPLTFVGLTRTNRFFANGNIGIGTLVDSGDNLTVSGSAFIDGTLTAPTMSAANQIAISTSTLSGNSGQVSITAPNLVTTPSLSAGLSLLNSTAATSGVNVQISPALILRSNTFSTTAQYSDLVIYNRGHAGATSTPVFVIGSSANGGAVSDLLTVGNNAISSGISGTVAFSSARIQCVSFSSGNSIVVGGGAGAIIATSAVLEVRSTTGGFLPPRMTTAQRNAISSPAQALILYNTTTDRLTYRDATTWQEVQTATEITNNIAPAVALFNYYNFY